MTVIDYDWFDILTVSRITKSISMPKKGLQSGFDFLINFLLVLQCKKKSHHAQYN